MATVHVDVAAKMVASALKPQMPTAGRPGPWTAYESSADHAKFFKKRWTQMYPMQRRVYGTVTYGEALVMVCGGGVFVLALLSGIAANSVEGSGSLPIIPFALAFATACHNSIFTFLLGLPFERALFWHRMCGYAAFVMTGLHGAIAVADEGFSMGESGNPLAIASLALVLTSLWPIRRRFFEFFYYNHWVFIIIFGMFCLMHGAGGVGMGAILWLGDLVYRWYLAKTVITHEVDLDVLPSDVIRIKFPRGNFPVYKGGQYIFVCVPKLSNFQWHPFSISSAPHEPEVHIHIRVLGNWTKKLYDLAAQNSGTLKLKVWMEGPYGEPALDIESSRYQAFLLVSGGIGITPMQSICNELMEQHQRGRPMTKIWFVWSVRDKYMVDSVSNVVADPDAVHRLPHSFQPDNLHHVNSSDGDGEMATGTTSAENVLHTEFYLTRARNEADYAGAGIKPDVQEYLRFGRPNLPEIFTKMKAIAQRAGLKRVAVLTCGPDPLVKSVAKTCIEQSGGGVLFELHSETFAF